MVYSSAFSVHPVTLPQLNSALRAMGSSHKNSDGMTIELWRRCFEVVGAIVLHMVNWSLVTCILPTAYKHAIAVPLRKSGDTSSPVNFRPISFLDATSKLAEKVISQQIVDRIYLTSNSILSPEEFAYIACTFLRVCNARV